MSISAGNRRYLFALLILAGSVPWALAGEQPVEMTPANQQIAHYSADLSSPRSVLQSLYRLTDEFHSLVHEDGFTFENYGQLRNIRQQNRKLFDLREIPPEFRDDTAGETAVYLREALSRVPLPSLDEVPDENQMAVKETLPFCSALPSSQREVHSAPFVPLSWHSLFAFSTITSKKKRYSKTNVTPALSGVALPCPSAASC